MSQTVLGIDVSKATLDLALYQDDALSNRQFRNSAEGFREIVVWLRQRRTGKVHACLEATGQYGDGIAEYLYRMGIDVSVVNPARIKHYANSKLRRNKTDKADAQLIAEYCWRENPGLWTLPAASFKNLQALIRHLDDLQMTHSQTSNRLASGVITPEVVEQLQALNLFLLEQIKGTKQAVQSLIDHTPEYKRDQKLLSSIPGIGKLTAAKLLGEIRNIREFENARELAAYAGLTPRIFLSGTSVHRKSCLAKTGNANLRKALYMPALVAKRHNPIIHNLSERLLCSGHQPKEVIGAAMHKLLHLAYGVLKTGYPFDPNYLTSLQTP